MAKSKISDSLEKWIKEVSEVYKSKVQAADIRYTGSLEDMISYGVNEKSGKDILSAAFTLEAYLVLAEEWKFVEDGREWNKSESERTFPNVNALIEYVRKKPVIPQPYLIENKIKPNRSVIPTEKQIAFLIGRKIKNDGIAPNPLLAETLQEMRLRLVELLRMSVTDEVRDSINVTFSK